MSLEEQFELAKQDASLRQQFLDQVDLEEMSRFVKKVRYKPQPEGELESQTAMSTTPLFANIHILNLVNLLPFIKRHIDVYPKAFDKDYFPTLGHFLNILIDHEGQHAKDFYFHPFWIFDKQTAESSAYMNELLQSERRGLDGNHQARIAHDYCDRGVIF